MNKRLRSRVLALSVVSSSFLGSSFIAAPRPLFAQDKPSASDQLDRGQRLYDQKNYAEAKKVLLDVDPAQLPEDRRAKYTDLLTSVDTQLAKSSGASTGYDAAQAALDGDKLAAAAAGFQGVIDDAKADAATKEKARVQLALVKEKQAARAPQMKELLNQADALYKQDKLDEAASALDTVDAVGADLGWQDNQRPGELRRKIGEKRLELARAGTATPPAPANNTVAASPMDAAPNPSPMDVTPPTRTTAAPSAPVNTAADASPDLIGSEIARADLARQAAESHFRAYLNGSKNALGKGQYPQAVANAQKAIDEVDANRQYFSESEAVAMRDDAVKQLDAAVAAKNRFDAEQQARIQKEAAERDRRLADERAKSRSQRINSLMADANKFVEAQQYEQAAATLRQVILIDPTNNSAKLSLQMVEDKINYVVYQGILNQRSRETVRQVIQDNEEIIPYADLLVYPPEWEHITRTRVGDQTSQDSPQNRAVREHLEENLHEINAEQQGLQRVIDYLRQATNTNIFVNWKALETAGVDANTTVNVTLHDVPFKKALQAVLADVGGGTANLGYTIDDGVITISTRDDLNSAKYQVVRVFDIRDMLVQPDNNSRPPSFNLQDITRGRSGGSSGGSSSGSGGSLFNENGGANGENAGGLSHDQIVQQITDTIKSTVAPESWRDTGGTIGSIRELNGQLIVNQTVDNQTAVYNLLQQLRETRALQITIESRLLLVTNNFLDDFGFTWTLTLPGAGAVNPITGLPVTPPGTNALPSPFGNFVIGNDSTGAVPSATGVPGNLAALGGGSSAFSITGSILDNYSLALLLRATQADRRTVAVTAPRVTLFNGQRGYIAVTNQQNFVSNFNQTVSGGGINSFPVVATQLTVDTLNTGVVLFVEATVSADRRYVVMKIQPQLATLDGIDTFGVGGGNNNSSQFGGGVFVQLPRISYTTINTMVSVPDGGTLLLGGQKLVGESEIEIGVPVLSKIPGLSRLFTNRSLVKDERTLLVLVRPKIIIQKEIETELFGPGYDRPTGIPAAEQVGPSATPPTNFGVAPR